MWIAVQWTVFTPCLELSVRFRLAFYHGTMLSDSIHWIVSSWSATYRTSLLVNKLFSWSGYRFSKNRTATCIRGKLLTFRQTLLIKFFSDCHTFGHNQTTIKPTIKHDFSTYFVRFRSTLVSHIMWLTFDSAESIPLQSAAHSLALRRLQAFSHTNPVSALAGIPNDPWSVCKDSDRFWRSADRRFVGSSPAFSGRSVKWRRPNHKNDQSLCAAVCHRQRWIRSGRFPSKKRVKVLTK